jgi:hypothetical protein
MTQRERAIYAAKWREIARAFECKGEGGGYLDVGDVAYTGLCWADDPTRTGEFWSPGNPIQMFGDSLGAFLWPRDREGDDCRVIAAGLIAAMYETGEFDNE